MHNMLKSDRQRFTVLAATMVLTTLGVLSSTVYFLYLEATHRWEGWLTESVRNQARLIEAIARNEREAADRIPGYDWQAGVLQQLGEAQQEFVGFGRTGEFVLAWRHGDHICYTLRQRHALQGSAGHAEGTTVPFESTLAEPMRRALQGLSGTLVGLDYRGARVLAAHEPIKDLSWGLVAKIDLSEVRQPFLRFGGMAALAALVLLPAGALVFRITTQSIMQRLEVNATRMQAILDCADAGICGLDLDGRLTFVNPTAARMLGWRAEDIIGQDSHSLMHHTHEDGSPLSGARVQDVRRVEAGRLAPIPGRGLLAEGRQSFLCRLHDRAQAATREDGRRRDDLSR